MKWINKGDKVTFTVASLPGRTFESAISYLDPVIDPQTRVAKARAEVTNPDLNLKPEMFASGMVEAELPARSDAVIVPKSAVMWTGQRSVVYIKTGTGQGIDFTMREVMLGPALGESFIVEDGLQEGEEIAVNGTFSIDAAAQLAGRPSMMNPEGEPAMTGHDHGMAESPAKPEKPLESLRTDPEFKEQLTKVYEAYLEMKNAFVESNAGKVAQQAQIVKEAVDATDMSLLTGEEHMTWMDHLERLNNSITKIAGSDEIDMQREAFSDFNQTFYKSIKMFGLKDTTAYYQYCPMAFGNEGAFWLSETEEIKNPYFGNKMLKCGETREIIDPD